MATILVVEDEPIILDIVQFALEAKGHHVLRARSASEALEISSETRSESIDMLLTDSFLGGMTGWELAESVLKKRSQTKVLLMSGGIPDAIMEEKRWPFIQKPFDLIELVRKVETICCDA